MNHDNADYDDAYSKEWERLKTKGIIGAQRKLLKAMKRGNPEAIRNAQAKLEIHRQLQDPRSQKIEENIEGEKEPSEVTSGNPVEPSELSTYKLKLDEHRKGGYISSISIENFKGIGEKVTIHLKPITLMFGANSAGKSTVLQAMGVVHELLKNQRKFFVSGESLGSFFDLVHNHDLTRKIKITLGYELGDDGLGMEGVGYEEQFDVSFVLGSGWTSSDAEIYFADVLLCVAPIGNQDSISPLDLNVAHPLVGRFLDAFGEDSLKPYNFGKTDEDKNPWFMLGTEKEGDALLTGDYKLVPESSFEDEVENPEVFNFFNQFVLDPLRIILAELEKLRHVGPIRKIPEPGMDLSNIDLGAWYHGLAAWRIGLDKFNRYDPDHEVTDAADDEAWYFVETVNALEWFGYDLAIQGKAEFTIPHDCWSQLHDASITEEERGRRLVSGLQQVYGDSWHYNGMRNALILRDNNGLAVEPSAVGTGISQVFPVIAATVAEGAQFVAVEQPELHIHPKLQCELGDLFISQMHRYPERTFLLETHSEHLILRLLRRIRETASNELKDPSLALTPDDVGVLYVDELEDGVSITELPINEEGDFTRKWPKGFFAERAEELF